MRTFASCLLCLLPFALGIPIAVLKHRAEAPARATNDAQIVCPHCQVRGRVTTQRVRRKKGISGGKATGAVLTGGASLLATGLSRKENVTAASCGNCGSRWEF